MKKRLMATALALVMLFGTLPITAFAAASFGDVSTTAWYYDAVNYVYGKGIMAGVGKGTFSPETTLTRAELCQILYNVEGKPSGGKSVFSDVGDSAWYKNAVSWAAENGIVNGTAKDLFQPDIPISREQVVTILYRYTAYKKYDLGVPVSLEDYSDMDQLSDWAEDAMQWAVGEEIISGKTATTISPKGTATRAEAATMLTRFCQRMEAIQKFLAKDIEDFKGETVINFDTSDETNFAVLAEDVVSIESSEAKNRILSADEEEGKYKFSNIDETISKLMPGDVFYLIYGNGDDDYLLIKVGSIEIDGNTAIIKEGEATLADYFQYIDVGMDVDLSDEDYGLDDSTTPRLSENSSVIQGEAQPLGMAETSIPKPLIKSDSNILAKTIGGSSSTSLKFEIGGEAVSLAANVKLTFALKIRYDKTIFNIEEISVSVKQETAVEGKVSKNLTGKDDTYRKESKPVKVSIAPGVNIKLNVYFVFDIDSSIDGSLTGSVTTENGTKYSKGKVRPIKKSDGNFSLDLEGDFKLSSGLGISGNLEVLKVLKLSLSGESGVELTGTAEIVHISTQKDVKHTCLSCVDGSMDFYFKIKFKAKLGIITLSDWSPVTAKIKFKDFYISYRTIGASDKIEFGWGDCPYKQYLVTVIAVDDRGNRLGEVDIELVNADTGYVIETGRTKNDGTFQVYCDKGSYNVGAYPADKYQIANETISVKSGPKTITVTLNRKDIAQENRYLCVKKTIVEDGDWTLPEDGEELNGELLPGPGTAIYTYDDKGNVLKELWTDDWSNNETTTYTYDINGNVLTEVSTNAWGSSKIVYTYDSNGYLQTLDRGDGYKTIYTYDSNGHVQKEIYIDPYGDNDGAETTYTCDSNGNVLSELYGELKTTYTYDEQGRVATISQNDLSDSSRWYKWAYTYDDHNKMTSKIESFSDIDYIGGGNQVVETVTYRYINTYDDNGNLIRCKAKLDEEDYFTVTYEYQSFTIKH